MSGASLTRLSHVSGDCHMWTKDMVVTLGVFLKSSLVHSDGIRRCLVLVTSLIWQRIRKDRTRPSLHSVEYPSLSLHSVANLNVPFNS